MSKEKYLDVRGFDKLTPSEKREYEESFNNHKIFSLNKEDRMAIYHDVKDELAYYAINIISTSRGKTVGNNIFDGKACNYALITTIEKYEKGVKHDDGIEVKPFHYFRMIYSQSREDDMEEQDFFHISETIYKLSKEIREVIDREYEGDVQYIEDVVKQMKEDSNYKEHHDSTYDKAVEYTLDAARMLSLDYDEDNEDYITLRETVADKNSNTEREALSSFGPAGLDYALLGMNAFDKAKDVKLYRLIFTHKLLRLLKIKEGNQPFDIEPAGDYEIYKLLDTRKDELMTKLFLSDYIEKEIEDKPESLKELYGVYFNFIKGKLLKEDIAEYWGSPTSSFRVTREKMEEKISNIMRKL